jgi:mono/diheme cytochrome c family protein
MAKAESPFRWSAVSRTSAILFACILAGLVCAASAGCSRFVERRKAQEIARGQLLFETHCGGCHNGKKLAAGIQPPFLNGISQRQILPGGWAATNAQVRSTILTGRMGVMPSFQNTLTNREISDIIEYLRSPNGFQPQNPRDSGS